MADGIADPLVVDTDGVAAGVGGATALGVDAVSRFKIDFPGVAGVVTALEVVGILFAACLLAC